MGCRHEYSCVSECKSFYGIDILLSIQCSVIKLTASKCLHELEATICDTTSEGYNWYVKWTKAPEPCDDFPNVYQTTRPTSRKRTLVLMEMRTRRKGPGLPYNISFNVVRMHDSDDTTRAIFHLSQQKHNLTLSPISRFICLQFLRCCNSWSLS